MLFWSCCVHKDVLNSRPSYIISSNHFLLDLSSTIYNSLATSRSMPQLCSNDVALLNKGISALCVKQRCPGSVICLLFWIHGRQGPRLIWPPIASELTVSRMNYRHSSKSLRGDSLWVLLCEATISLKHAWRRAEWHFKPPWRAGCCGEERMWVCLCERWYWEPGAYPLHSWVFHCCF